MKRPAILLIPFILLGTLVSCAPKTHVRPGEAGAPGPVMTDLKKPVSSDQFEKAIAAIEGKEFSRKNAESFMTVAQYRFNQGDFKEALETYQKVVAAATGGPANTRAQYMVGHCYYELRQYLPALSAFQKTQTLFPGSTGAGSSRQMTEFILQYALSTGELRAYLENYPDSSARCTALFQLGRRESEEGRGGEAVTDLGKFVQDCPQHASVPAAKLLLTDWQNRKQGGARRVGLLIPRTGRLAALGTSVLNGVNLAIEEARSNGSDASGLPELTVKDTQGDSVVAVRAFKELVQEGGVQVVVGPLTKEEIGAVAPLANDIRVAFISPSASREGFAALGPFVFRNSMTNEMQGRVMARYATESLGIKRFAVLSPDDGYGETLSQSFMQEVAARGGTITAYHTYFPNASDFKRPILELGGFDPTDLKEGDRENTRRAQQLDYTLRKEVRKLLMTYSASSNTGNAVALVPLPEGLTNTACPSIAPDVRRILQEALEEASKWTVRKDDLVEQAVTRLPDDVRGTTLAAKAEDWAEILGEVQASLLLNGRIVETDPPDEWGRDETWDFVIEIEAWWSDPARKGKLRTVKSRVPYSLYKAPEIIRRPVNYDALYLPAHTREISLLMTQIRFYDLSPVLLGGHLWEDRSILKEGGNWPKGAYLVTGFYAESPDGDVQDFVQRYQKKYASKPDLLAAQGYDAMRLVLQASDGALSGEEVRKRLSGINGFRGVSGETSFNGSGEAEKKVPVLKIENGRFQQVQ